MQLSMSLQDARDWCRSRLGLQGEAVRTASLEVYQAVSAAASPTEMARVLPLLEKLLCQAGLMRATWAEHWQHSWQRAASYCVDWKHALLLTASLQVRSWSEHLLCLTAFY